MDSTGETRAPDHHGHDPAAQAVQAAWNHLESLAPPSLTALFAADPNRHQALTLEEAGLRFSFAKTHLTPASLQGFATLAAARDLAGHRAALFAGQIVNPSEHRAAEHCAERGTGAPESVARAGCLHERMRILIEAIDADAFGRIEHILHIGIGGSALGPQLVIDALAETIDPARGRRDAVIVSNIDGLALDRAFDRLNPQTTLIAIASKTFTTAETLMNATSALQWLEEAGVDDPLSRVIALTAAPDKAIEWGVDETRILPFSETVGGRYSLWSTIGFPIAWALGWDVFSALLEGAAQMDRHFHLAPFEANAPVLAAWVDLFYAQLRGCATRAIFAYDERLKWLPAYLQQLEMESNGKSVGADGRPLDRPSAPITWGGVGTDAQHAVFQLLHQGTQIVPVEFVGIIEPADLQDPEHHRQLLVNAFAQGAALMTGKPAQDPARAYPGDRPSMTVLADRLDGHRLGALLAFYEQRTFVNAVLLGLNPFDQFGVELGKAMARAIDDADARAAFDADTRALIERAGA